MGSRDSLLTLPRMSLIGRSLLTALLATSPSLGAGSPSEVPLVTVARVREMPIERRADYLLGAAIRPLPLLWIGRDDVGAGRLTWRRGDDGQPAYEFVGGSEPSRTPRGINRWAYVAEEVRADGRRLVSLIKQSDEKTLGEVTQGLGGDADRRRFPFKLYASHVGLGQVRAGDAVFDSAEDLTSAGLDLLLQQAAHTTVRLRPAPLAPGTRTGILEPLTDLLRESAVAWQQGRIDALRGRRIAYSFNNSSYELTIAATEYRQRLKLGALHHTEVLHSRFEGRQPGTSKKMSLEVWSPARGPDVGLPLRIVVQPRWWFRFELTLVRLVRARP